MKIIGISDVSVGYGSPQILALINSLINYYDAAEAMIIEPDQPNTMPFENKGNLKIFRVDTTMDPYSETGRREYILTAAKIINKMKPEVLVVFCTFCLPVLFKLNYRPQKTIYYHIEYAPFYGDFDIEMNKYIGNLIDLAIYPEENRAQKDIQICGYKDVPFVIAYNSAGSKDDIDICPANSRNGRILYAGNISKDYTFADYYIHPELNDARIDLYGSITGSDKHSLEFQLKNASNGVKYCGFINNKELSNVRKQYSFSIVSWNPINDNFLYACPNKFFESIFDGVPPITAPHPQCKMIVEQYKCGIVMKDWSFVAFREAIEKAKKIMGSEEHYIMIENCKKAALTELNWEEQFGKILKFL